MRSLLGKRYTKQLGIHIDSLNDINTECCLHQKLLEKDIAQSKQMRSRLRQIKAHDNLLEKLLHEIHDLNQLIEKRIQYVY